jgi:hypothetical protein
MVESAPAAKRLVAILEERGWKGWTRIERVPADPGRVARGDYTPGLPQNGA